MLLPWQQFFPYAVDSFQKGLVAQGSKPEIKTSVSVPKNLDKNHQVYLFTKTNVPANIRHNNVASTSLRRHDVAATLKQRYNDAVC